jgi:hypothetical protein
MEETSYRQGKEKTEPLVVVDHDKHKAEVDSQPAVTVHGPGTQCGETVEKLHHYGNL